MNAVSRATKINTENIAESIGSHISVTLQHQTCSGFIYYIDQKILILQRTHSNNIDLITIPCASIKNVQLIDSKRNIIELSCTLEQAKKRLQEASREEKLRLGVGVSLQAQSLFDALQKTLPVSWKGKSIIVMEEVLIDAPYSSAECRLLPNGEVSTLERVKKVVQGERRRLGI